MLGKGRSSAGEHLQRGHMRKDQELGKRKLDLQRGLAGANWIPGHGGDIEALLMFRGR